VQTDDDSWLNDIVSLLQNKKKKKTATFRSFEQERGNLATNLIDIESQGNICIDADKPIGLWRRDDIETLEVHFGIVAGTDIDLYWSADEQTIPWPRLLKQQTEQAYRIRMAGKGTEHQFKLHYFPPSFDSPYHQIAWMNQQHCETQALELLQTHQQP